MQRILANIVVSVSELKENPLGVMADTGGMPVALLDHNRVVGYMVPADFYEQMMARLDLVEAVSVCSTVQGMSVDLDNVVDLDALFPDQQKL